jgi:hypothetical protein
MTIPNRARTERDLVLRSRWFSLIPGRSQGDVPPICPSQRHWIGGARTCRRRIGSAAKDPCSVAGPGRLPAGDPGDGLCGTRLVGRPGGLADSAGRAGRVRALPAGSPLTPASLLRNRPRSRPFGHMLGWGESAAASPTLTESNHSVPDRRPGAIRNGLQLPHRQYPRTDTKPRFISISREINPPNQIHCKTALPAMSTV